MLHHDDLEVAGIILTLPSVPLLLCFVFPPCRGDLQHDNGLQLDSDAHVGPERLGHGHE